MSGVTSGSCLRSLALTPKRIPNFTLPRSPLLLLSPRRSSPDRTRLLSDPDDDSPRESLNKAIPVASPRVPVRLPPRIRTPRIRTPRCASATATTESADVDADTDVTTRAAMSLPHVGKVTAPYGFRAVLAASPCTLRRESLFHRNKPVTVTVTEPQDPSLRDPTDLTLADPGPGSSRAWSGLRSVKALGLQVVKELKRPAAALKTLSPGSRKT